MESIGNITVWFRFLHVAAALWLTTGVFGSAVVRVRMKRADSIPGKAMAVEILWRLHVVYTLPGVVVSGLLGLHLVGSIGYRYGAGWVLASIALWLFVFLAEVFVVTPSLSRARKAGEAAKEDPGAEATFLSAAGAKLWGILSDVSALAILVMVWLMIFRI